MSEEARDRVAARFDFDAALARGVLARTFAWLLGRNPDLLALDEIRRAVRPSAERYEGVRAIPLDRIVGSEGRYRDFDRFFFPRHDETRDRWESIDRARRKDVALPPITAYRVGDAYVVRDGNHRVSVARRLGAEFIDAEVIDLPADLCLGKGEDPRDALLAHEVRRFLDETGLDRTRPGHGIRPTRLGACDHLREHIGVHRWYLGEKRRADVPGEEAVLDWHDHVYRPLVGFIEEARLPRLFPERTATDLYLWVTDHWHHLKEEHGLTLPPEIAAADFAERFSPRLLDRLERFWRTLRRGPEDRDGPRRRPAHRRPLRAGRGAHRPGGRDGDRRGAAFPWPLRGTVPPPPRRRLERGGTGVLHPEGRRGPERRGPPRRLRLPSPPDRRGPRPARRPDRLARCAGGARRSPRPASTSGSAGRPATAPPTTSPRAPSAGSERPSVGARQGATRD